MHRSCKFTVLLVIWAKISEGCDNYGEHLIKVSYYEDLIIRKINDSKHYNLPTNADEYKPKTDHVHDYGWYDFVIIGAGSTGSVIANRLSEIRNWKVLILEAGGSPDEFSKIPGLHSYLTNSEFSWNYKTIPQQHSCLGMVNQKCRCTRGKIIGGSSGINGMVYDRGDKEDFNRWEALGNKGWSYKDVLPYFIKSENCQSDGDPYYHGKGGYWNVKSMKENNPQFSAFVEAHEEHFNCTVNNDYNGFSHLGISPIQFNVIRNKRHSAGIAFLESVEKRKNLEILEKAYVTKILFKGKRAYGVEFTLKGKLYHVRSTKEIILSAGAISSPHILMLSGIGPKEELTKFNIPLVNDLPVGQTLIEQPGFEGVFVQTNYAAPQKTVRQNVEEYLSYEGDYERPGNAYGMGYYRSSAGNNVGYPDFGFKFIAAPSVNNFEKENMGLTEETYNGLWGKRDISSAFNIYIYLLHPKSVGNLKLASADPYEFPLIDLNMLDDPYDIEVLYQSILLLQKLIETSAMKAINASFVYGNFPQCEEHGLGSKEYWVCIIRLTADPCYASIGSCRMGLDRKSSVVDNKLRVHGIQNLRVADISVFPNTISAPPTATAVMVGEKVSDLIKIYYKKHVDTINNVFV